jgi:hypothetical protein
MSKPRAVETTLGLGLLRPCSNKPINKNNQPNEARRLDIKKSVSGVMDVLAQ